MRNLKVGAAVLNQTPLDWENNQRHIREVLDQARNEGVSVLCLPEMCIPGYGCEDTFHAPFVAQTSWRILQELLPATRGMIVSLGLPVWHHMGIFNCAALVADGKLLGLVAKQNLAGDGVYYEPRWFKPWPHLVRGEFELDGTKVPIGDLVFDVGGLRIGFEICEDAWVADRPGGELARYGLDLIFNPSASHFAFGKIRVREGFVQEGSRAFALTYLYANLLGNDAGRIIFDGGALIASNGKLLAVGPRFSFQDHVLTTAVVDVDASRMIQARTASFRHEVCDRPGTVKVAYELPWIAPQAEKCAEFAPWERGPRVKEEEFTRAVALGLFDYMRKSRSHGFVVSLSGGADSAACACLVRLLVELALREIGPEGLARKLAFLGANGGGGGSSVERWMKALLACVYQSTKNSGSVTRDAARQVAAAVHAEYHEFDVEALADGYEKIVEKAIGRKLAWDKDDLARQNVQARARSPGVWLLANLRNALLLATSNRSEVAVGYCTMDGDTSGGLAPIAGIDKAFLRRWLEWLEKEGPDVSDGPFRIAALAAINAQEPTAELRPPGSRQTDESDLMPYPLLDAMEGAAIRDKLSPADVLARMRLAFPAIDAQKMHTFVERFFRLWARTQWKRERYAPSFHLDDKNLDPKTWCRFPILSGGFEMELREM